MVIIQHSNFKYSRLYQNYQKTVPVINIPSLVCSWNSSWVTMCHISYINQFSSYATTLSFSGHVGCHFILLACIYYCMLYFTLLCLYMYCMLYFTLLYFMYICAFNAFCLFLFCIYLIPGQNSSCTCMIFVLNSWRCLEYLQHLKTSNGCSGFNIVKVQFFVPDLILSTIDDDFNGVWGCLC